jgi:hypothetical protein
MLDDERVNLARYVFAHPRAHEVYAEWDAAADEQVARLRAAEPRGGQEPPVVEQLAEHRTADDVAARGSTQPVAEKRRGAKRLHGPDVGELHLAYEVLVLPDDDQQLVTWRAADDLTAGKLVTLLRDTQPVSPPQLSVVVNR